ncbi:P-loop NTPase fold protein [Sphingobacterium faecale]|uniref:AAA family ATPase n=1 Tax=Sphingobacterium faecale TaxID=2803775 RepID=A0ABS1R8P8_9SPHI|nr:P-loop NTPase fold protein [Sphingobacterium faecale]MBL1411094.1 AAA family ATPase [Sphingobacterium faecale]
MTPGQTEPFVINQDSLEQQFKDHLADTDNHRILFSGPFGQGKTTFLNKVFEDEQAEYHTIKLYPVNYSVSSNEDVFQLIKFDILTQLIGKYGNQLDLQQEDFSKLLTAQVFVRDSMSLTPWIEAILSCFGNIGKSSSNFFKAFTDTVKDFNAFHKAIQPNETKDIETFVGALINKERSAIEMDSISEKVKELIIRLQAKTEHKVVLVIDDLDRLDPEHIFRLFNVFSTHFEYRGESLDGNGCNKFGFDKIIFVCDIENIRRIYRHKYGAGVDFKGYLDKFYSHAPFDFDNRHFVCGVVYHLLRELKANEKSRSNTRFIYLTQESSRYNMFVSTIEWLLNNLINARLLNLRSLLQVTDVRLKDIPITINPNSLDSSSYPLIILFQLLLAYYPTIDIIKEKLDSLAQDFYKDKNSYNSEKNVDNSSVHSAVLGYAIPFITDPKKMITYRLEDKDKTVIYSKELTCYIHFKAEANFELRTSEFYFLKSTSEEDLESENFELNVFEVLSVALSSAKKIGVLE